MDKLAASETLKPDSALHGTCTAYAAEYRLNDGDWQKVPYKTTLAGG